MLTLSASRIKLYQECRARYHQRYILGVKDPLNTSALMGSALHKAIEYHYKYPHKNSSYVFARYMQAMFDWWHKSGKEYREYEQFYQLIKTGKHILDAMPWDNYEPLQQELAFTLPFTEHTMVHGFIDMVTEDRFIDFKSSKHKPKDLQNDPQFIIYAYAFRELRGKYPEYGIWHTLRTHEIHYFNVEPSTLDKKIDSLKELAETIYSDDFSNLTKCNKCPPWCKVEL